MILRRSLSVVMFMQANHAFVQLSPLSAGAALAPCAVKPVPEHIVALRQSVAIFYTAHKSSVWDFMQAALLFVLLNSG